MSNDIDAIYKQQPAAAQQTAASRGPDARPDANKAGSQTSSDTVQLTESARAMHELERAVANAPVVDSERVSELAQAVASGEYQVDAERVAEKILQFDREFGSPE